MRVSWLLALLAGWAVLPGVAAAKPFPVTTRLNVAYGTLGEQMGDVYTPEGMPPPSRPLC